jgi:low-affinity ferrous iron transport protein
MVNLIRTLSAPGMRQQVTRTAKTMLPDKSAQVTEHQLDTCQEGAALTNGLYATDEGKPRLLDRWLDSTVAASGSTPVLFLIVALVVLWALMGIRDGGSENWQVLISDAQALLCYIFDSLLMRQQLNAYDREIRISAIMQSRSVSVRRILREFTTDRGFTKKSLSPRREVDDPTAVTSAHIQRSTRISRIIDLICDILGHVITLVLFWIGIFIWLGFGPYCSWSVRWQLYMNSATSALMVLVFALLASIREQHKRQTSAYLRHLCDIDAKLESQLRQLTEDKTLNEPITIYPGTVTLLERAILYYADLVGTLIGICLLMFVVVVWVAIGPALHFSSNWWLIIGTYAGLIGMHDGFVLHNVQSQLDRDAQAALADVVKDDMAALAIISTIPPPNSASSLRETNQVQPATSAPTLRPNYTTRLSTHLSTRLSLLISHPLAVLAGIFLIITLLVSASALRWSTTGQLLCNVPPSIVETFVMMALITRERLDWNEEEDIWQTIGKSRAVLLEWAKKQSPERITGDIEVVVGEKLESGEMTTRGEFKSQEMDKIVEA